MAPANRSPARVSFSHSPLSPGRRSNEGEMVSLRPFQSPCTASSATTALGTPPKPGAGRPRFCRSFCPLIGPHARRSNGSGGTAKTNWLTALASPAMSGQRPYVISCKTTPALPCNHWRALPTACTPSQQYRAPSMDNSHLETILEPVELSEHQRMRVTLEEEAD